MIAYALTVFSGAFLVFLVQPLIAKFILPWFGGGPSVWTVCMVFFQVLLLGGYTYAHLTTRFLRPRSQGMLHIGLLGLALLTLPITPAADWQPGPEDEPVRHILLLLFANVGLSYFVLSATGPLLQRWYSGAHSASPYRLYALSNLGSVLALLLYPFVIEPEFTRQAQAEFWSWSMVAFAVVCGYCAWLATKQVDPPETAPVSALGREASVPARDYVLWLALPCVASVMLLATTNKLCQEVAVIPFLWVLPLSLYLFSFVLCFEGSRWYHRTGFGMALLFLMTQYEYLSSTRFSYLVWIGMDAALLFVVCMVCHGELYRLRPPPRSLTAFYLVIASAGALGGIFVAFIAPLLFVSFEEFELAIIACGVLALVVHYLDKSSPLHGGRPRWAWSCLLLAFIGVGATMIASLYAKNQSYAFAARDFYGALYIRYQDPENPLPVVPALWSGNTSHGLQIMLPSLQRKPTTYYSEESGIGIALLNHPRPQQELNIGVVGLGIGTLAAYTRPGDRIRFYELDPRVVDIAFDRFTYLEQALAAVDVVVGDARLALEREPPQGFDVLVLDAFTSDATPVHLLTTQAFEIYWKHVTKNGLLAVHISNRHLDLRPVLAALGQEFDLTTLHIENTVEQSQAGWYAFDSAWVLLTRSEAILSIEAIVSAATVLDENTIDPVLWTDERTSLFPILR